MSSAFEPGLSLEELKRRNLPNGQGSPTPQEWEALLERLEGLEASVEALAALSREISTQVGNHPTQAQWEALSREVAELRRRLPPAGRRGGRRFSPPRLPKLSLLRPSPALLLIPPGLLALWAGWYSLSTLWSVLRTVGQWLTAP